MDVSKLLAPDEAIRVSFTGRFSLGGNSSYEDFPNDGVLHFTNLRAIISLTPRRNFGDPGWYAIPNRNIAIIFFQSKDGRFVQFKELSSEGSVNNVFVLSPNEKGRSDELQKALLQTFR